ncbi:MAG TPA: hypothetical protein VFB72_07320 [Verrucomicrobiae bacterium]|nr:hypothetical protein [Verrucomicrobiae bacterium]
MKTKIAALMILGAALVVLICIAGVTQVELKRTVARTEALEKQVRTLQASNAKMERELRDFSHWKVVPVQAQ